MMKKLFAKGFTAIAGVMLLTSCLGDGNNETQSYWYGIVETVSNKKVVRISDSLLPLYDEIFARDADYTSGDCVFVNYKVNYDEPENQNAIKNGYYKASLGYYKVEKTDQIFSTLTDTTTLLTDEVVLKDIVYPINGGENITVKKHTFIKPIYPKYKQYQENEYNISFDPEQEPTMISGKKIYTLYVRSVFVAEGKGNEYENNGEDIAVNFTHLYNSLGGSQIDEEDENYLFFQLKFPEEIDKENGKIKKWGTSSAIFSIYIPKSSNS